jgi:hypothetical protein
METGEQVPTSIQARPLCAAKTLKGTPCKNYAKAGSKYCGRHIFSRTSNARWFENTWFQLLVLVLALAGVGVTIYYGRTGATKEAQDQQTEILRKEKDELESFKPKLKLMVNGTFLDENDILRITNLAPSLHLEVQNIGILTAEHVAIHVFSPLDETNVIANGWNWGGRGGWRNVNINVNGQLHEERRDQGHWFLPPEPSVPSYGRVAPVTPFIIKTNYEAVVMPISIVIYADRGKRQEYLIWLVDPKSLSYVNILPGSGTKIKYPTGE